MNKLDPWYQSLLALLVSEDQSFSKSDRTGTGTKSLFGVQFRHDMSEGYEPIGFFQLWHPNTSGVKLYPETHGSADRTDVQFAKKWTRKNRILIPEVIAIHLDSENATVDNMGKNWNGRKSKHFGTGYSPEIKKRSCWEKIKSWFK